ncbi:MAG: DUF169 domain-containing protein [Thermoplasmata archaeon]|nr:DUF169 domain-containing protein [Thermoplasmata archaeon]
MSRTLQQISEQLMADLELSGSPIQISYLDSPPEGVGEHPGGAPSVCTFFAEGQRAPFYAGMQGHEACEIGAFVLGIPPEGEKGKALMSMVGMMQKEGYLHPGEEAQIPRNPNPPKFIAYGPLGSLPMPPTTVLIFARPKSAMIAVEAANGPVPMNGRPMCAIVPTLNAGAPVAISTACIGSRIYTQMGDDQMVIGVRGDHLETFAGKVRTLRIANQLVGDENRRRRTASAHPFERPRGGSPSGGPLWPSPLPDQP